MGSKKKTCIKLLKEGYSYNDIKSKLKVAKSTLNSWFTQLSEEEKNKIRSFRVKNWRKSVKKYQTEKHHQTLAKERESQDKAAKKVGHLTKRELFLTGTALYWAEGTKTNRWQLQFSNSDPKMISLIMRFLREICGVNEEQFYLQMILHQNIKEKTALNYWSKITKIPKGQFKKACYTLSKSSQKIRNRNRLPFGTLQIRILNKNLTHQVYGFINGLKQAGGDQLAERSVTNGKVGKS